MPERKEIASINVITDCDTSMYEVGEVDGGFLDRDTIKEHIKSYGADDLLRKLNLMIVNVIEIEREVNMESQPIGCACMG
jgi:hypothetical protein